MPKNRLHKPRSRIIAALLALFILLGTTTVIVMVTSATPAHASDTDTYSWSDANYVDANYDWGYSTCPSSDPNCKAKVISGYGVYDPWSYYLRNCTSYVAEKISQEFKDNGSPRNISGWGNAANWATAAQAAHYSLDPVSAPQVGDIAVWGPEVGGGYGHVAYVYAVSNGVGSLDEYNSGYPLDVNGKPTWGNFYSGRTTASGSAGAPDWYIHMGTPADAASSTPSPPPPPPPIYAPAMVVRSSDEADIAAVDTTNAMNYYYNFQGNPSWGELPVAVAKYAFSAPAMVVRSSGEADIAIQGPSNSLDFYIDSQGMSQWGNIQVDGGGSTYSAPAMLLRSSGEVDIAVQGEQLSNPVDLNMRVLVHMAGRRLATVWSGVWLAV